MLGTPRDQRLDVDMMRRMTDRMNQFWTDAVNRRQFRTCCGKHLFGIAKPFQECGERSGTEPRQHGKGQRVDGGCIHSRIFDTGCRASHSKCCPENSGLSNGDRIDELDVAPGIMWSSRLPRQTTADSEISKRRRPGRYPRLANLGNRGVSREILIFAAKNAKSQRIWRPRRIESKYRR